MESKVIGARSSAASPLQSAEDDTMTHTTLTDPKLRGIADEVRTGLNTLYGYRLRGLYLYGSYARGDQGDESDLDILVLLDDTEDVGEELHRMSELGSRLSLAHDLTITFSPVTEWEFQNLNTPWLLNVRREAIAL